MLKKMGKIKKRKNAKNIMRDLQGTISLSDRVFFIHISSFK